MVGTTSSPLAEPRLGTTPPRRGGNAHSVWEDTSVSIGKRLVLETPATPSDTRLVIFIFFGLILSPPLKIFFYWHVDAYVAYTIGRITANQDPSSSIYIS
jgi:hypothetical protein